MSRLNPRQQEAVSYVGGPLLVLAGAGSGKTSVITRKIAHLIQNCGIRAQYIVAMTFTNKAAREMKERVGTLLKKGEGRGLTVSTFHNLGLNIIRKEHARLGYKPGFSIFDDGDIKALLTEVLFLHATFEHNIKLWVRSYPFHVGMYMLMGGTIIVLCAVFAQLFGLNPQGGLMLFVGNVINAMVLVGTLCIIIGGIGLIERRRNDDGLRRYSTPEHYFNLVIFIVFGLLGLAAWAFSPSYFELARTFIYNLITLNFAPQTSMLFSLHLLVGFFLLIWIPMTHMGHVFMKYFTYHDIRWGDEPTSYSEKNKQKILEALKFNVTWSAKHISGDGAPKSWVDVATTNPTEKKED